MHFVLIFPDFSGVTGELRFKCARCNILTLTDVLTIEGKFIIIILCNNYVISVRNAMYGLRRR